MAIPRPRLVLLMAELVCLKSLAGLSGFTHGLRAGAGGKRALEGEEKERKCKSGMEAGGLWTEDKAER
jgi:hypothetical protein